MSTDRSSEDGREDSLIRRDGFLVDENQYQGEFGEESIEEGEKLFHII
jgi:hypothetical protein